MTSLSEALRGAALRDELGDAHRFDVPTQAAIETLARKHLGVEVKP